MKQLLSSLAGFAVIFTAITLLALEASDVVTVQTTRTSADGAVRKTHIWFAEAKSGIVLEAGHPSNPWVKDLRHMTSITLEGAQQDGVYDFVVVDGLVAHQEIRRLMREKYGWRDWWVDMLFDTSESQMIKLTKQ